MHCAYFRAYFYVLNYDNVDIEKSDGMCLPTFAEDEFSGLFSHPSVFFQICIKNKWHAISDFLY